jgi:hypothetical protein
MNWKAISTAAAATALTTAALVVAATTAEAGDAFSRMVDQRGQFVNRELQKTLGVREERIHYYDAKGRKYDEERVRYDVNTRKVRSIDKVPRHQWTKR